jgi:hypothetical protein
MPCCRIESISSWSASRAKSLRGCSALGTMFVKLIWWTRSPDSIASGRVATEGVPINAPRPLPRPDRAMRLRLREQFHQRKQQSAMTQQKRCQQSATGRIREGELGGLGSPGWQSASRTDSSRGKPVNWCGLAKESRPPESGGKPDIRLPCARTDNLTISALLEKKF